MAKKPGGQYLLKKAEKTIQSLAEEAKAKKAAKVPAEPKTTPKADRPAGIGHNNPPPDKKTPTKAQQRMLDQQAKLDAATARVEEAFKPYEGAKPDVPQREFQRSNIGRQTIDPVILRAIEDPGVRQSMLEAMSRGMSMQDWYNMEQTRLMWGDVVGSQDVGTQRFNRFQDYMGSTSPLSKVDPNLKNASRWNYYDINQLPAEEQLTTIPHPTKPGKEKEKLNPPPPKGYGGAGQINQFKLSLPLLTGQVSELDPEEYLKTSRYTGDLKGNLANVAVDRHAVRAPLMYLGDPGGLARSVKLSEDVPAFNAQELFAKQGGNIADLPATYWKDEPANAAEYYALEDYYKSLAQELGVRPGEGQAMGWTGSGEMTGLGTEADLTAQQLFNQRVAKTAIERNMDPRDVLTMLMKGSGYLSLGGIGLGAAEEFMPGRFEEEQPL